MKNYLVIPKTLSKYRNVQTEYKGIKFMSKKEAEYAMQLDWQRKAKNPSERVVEWVPQVPFVLQEAFMSNGKKIPAIKYIADFVVTYADGHKEVVDVKGVATDIYRLKKKLLLYKYRDIDFKEIH